MLSANPQEGEKTMNQRLKKKLEAIMKRYSGKKDDESLMLCHAAFTISEDKGYWSKDGKPFSLKWYNLEGIVRSTSNAIFWRDSETDGLTGVKRFKNGKLFAFNDYDYQCEITDPDLIAVIEQLAHIQKNATPQKPKAKKHKPKGKKFRVWFQVMGSSTDSNNIGYAIIRAKDEKQAIEFAREDLTKRQFKNIEISSAGRNTDFDLDEDEQDEDEPLYCYDIDWEADGKHGKYYARSGPYAKDEEEAIQFQREDLTMGNGFMGFESELEAEEEPEE